MRKNMITAIKAAQMDCKKLTKRSCASPLFIIRKRSHLWDLQTLSIRATQAFIRALSEACVAIPCAATLWP